MSGVSTDPADVAELFAAAGVPQGLVGATLARLGGTAGADLRADPWRLLAVRGVRPEQADHFAERVLGGFAGNDPRRGRALIEHLLARAAGDGHTVLPARTIAAALSSYGIADPAPALRAALDAGEVMTFESPGDADTGRNPDTDDDPGIDGDAGFAADETDTSAVGDTGTVAAGGPSLGLTGIALAEESLAEGLHRLTATAEPFPATTPDDPGGDSPVSEALRQIAGHGACVVGTGPGGGPYRDIGRLVRALGALAEAGGRRLAVAAPTARAAREVTRASGVPAVAVYELLEAHPDGSGSEVGYRRDERNPLDADIVVLTGAAALGVEPAAALVEACPDGAHLVFAGDPRELPPFGPGRVLGDLMESGLVPLTDLSDRPAGGDGTVDGAHGPVHDRPGGPDNGPDNGTDGGPDSGARGGDVLGDLARAVGAGRLPPVRSAERRAVVVTARDAAEAAHRVVQLVTDSIPRAIGIAPEDIQVITPVRRGAAGADALNALLKARLNGPDRPGAPVAGSPGGPGTASGSATGSPVGGVNGGAAGDAHDTAAVDAAGGAASGDADSGGFVRFAPGDRVLLTGGYPAAGIGETGMVTAVDPEEIEIDFSGTRLTVPAIRFDAIRHAWAMTVHRAHGSVWPAVVAVLPGEAAGTLSRPLVYTAFTRALVHLSVVHAAGPALANAVRVSEHRPRRTRLAGLLGAAASPAL